MRRRMGRLSLRFAFRFLQAVLPRFFKILFLILETMGVALFCFLKGIPETTDEVARQWVNELLKQNFPTAWAGRLHTFCKLLAYLIALIGWISLSYVTVFIMTHIF